MTMDEMLAICDRRTPSAQQFDMFCRDNNLNRSDALDQISITVARRYLAGALSYAIGDGVMNSVFAFATHSEGDIPDVMFRVYSAFDEAEHTHHGKYLNVDLEAKYTRPMLASVLEGIDAV